jgi:putative lipoic acid-binding regulatory protein
LDPGQDIEKFRELLDGEYDWPAQYTFKFVVASGHIKAVQTLFSKEAKISVRESSGGKYTSVTINVEMANADEVIEIYKQASVIEGIISL